MEVKNIIFDFGGVLIDWNPKYLYRKIFNDESEMDYFLNEICNMEWNVQQDAGRPFEVAIDELVAIYPKYKTEINSYFTRWIEMISGPIYENVEVIDLLGNYNLYGLTNWSAETFPLVYEKYSFFQKLDGIVVSGEEKVAKPDEEIFITLLNRYKLNAEDSLFIDDNYENIRVAEKLGFKTIHLTNDIDLKASLEKFVNL